MSDSFFKRLEWEKFKQKTLTSLEEIHPRCCYYEKALKMMDLVYEVRPHLCVEIGVYGGASIYPTASVLKYLKQGIVVGIDPWSQNRCMEGLAQEGEEYQWWAKKDLEVIFWAFVAMVEKYDLAESCRVIRSDGASAVQGFENGSIDILHIDGNHSETVSFKDVELYLPKMKKGGYVWFDDVNMPATNRAVSLLSRSAEFIPSFSIEGKCHLYRI